jgi:hypothetical protein
MIQIHLFLLKGIEVDLEALVKIYSYLSSELLIFWAKLKTSN